MKLIVDSGGTKTDWCFRDAEGQVRHHYSGGMNFSYMDADTLSGIMREAAEAVGSGVEEVHLYAAGLVEKPSTPLEPFFPGARVYYQTDLLGAARAVCGREKGIAVILGTGSNSCLYDGQQIVRNIRPGGFILGDEGSGAVLGKSFLSDLIKGLVPEDTAAAYAAEGYPADYPSIVREVYKSAAPAAFMGSLAPWIVGRYEEDDYLKGLVDNNFRQFIRRVLLQYGAEAPVGVVGGFGCACKPVLQRLGREAGLSFTTFLPSPMEGLVAYHYGL